MLCNIIKYTALLFILSGHLYASAFAEPIINIKQSDNVNSEVESLINKVEDIKVSEDFVKKVQEAGKIVEKVDEIKKKKEYNSYKGWVSDNKVELFAKQSDDKILNKDVSSKDNKNAINQLLSNYRFKSKDIKKGTIKYYPLMIFVSSSMPKESLKNIMIQARRSGGVLVFRGIIGGIKNTSRYLAEISKENVSAIIDPRLFKTFAVTQAPTFVMLSNNIQNIEKDLVTPIHDRISGNVTLHYFLNKIVDEEGDAKPVAFSYLKRLNNKK